MKSNTYLIIRFFSALLTIAAIAGQSYIPKKRLLIHPSPTTNMAIDGYIDPTQGRSATWIDEKQYSWSCNIHAEWSINTQGCGASLSWGVNFSNDQEANTSTATCENSTTDTALKNENQKNQQDCKVTAHPIKTQETPQFACKNPQSDVDGDGIGMEHGQLCVIASPEDYIESVNHPTPKFSHKNITQTDLFKGIDFSVYENIELNLHYEGRAPHLRVYLRNANPEYTKTNDYNTTKFMSVSVPSEDLTTGTLQIKLNDFSVAQWWSLTNPLPRRLTGLELNNITSLGVDHITPGLHKVRLDKIELTGQRLSMEKLLLILAMLWVCYLFCETLFRYLSLRKKSLQSSKEIDHLTNRTRTLEAEKNIYKELAITDVLTGILNRTGITQFAGSLFQQEGQNDNVGLMILDIDHFKVINDTFGHDVGDRILISIAQIICSNIRDNDIFGRWGGEEFIIVCPKTNTQDLLYLAEKLRSVIEYHHFQPEVKHAITISIGATSVDNGETFSDAFKRADIALYNAKNERNKVSFQPIQGIR